SVVRVRSEEAGPAIGGIVTDRALVSDLGRPVRGPESQAPPRLLATRGTRGPSAPRGRSCGSRPPRCSLRAAPLDAIARQLRGDATTTVARPPGKPGHE